MTNEPWTSTTQAPATYPGSGPSAWRAAAFSFWGFFFSLLIAGVVGAVILLVWDINTTNPCPCRGDFCIFGNPATGGADAHLPGIQTILAYASFGLLLVAGLVVVSFRERLRHPFMILAIGLPVFYGGVLASIWAVARTVWGPTRC